MVQELRRAEGALIAGRDVEADDLLPLVLLRIVVVVGNLEPVARREEIQVEGIDVAAGW